MLEKNQKGFSLVELMVVIGIVSLLVLVALPSYRNFILKAEFIETKMAVSAVKVSLEVCVQTLGLAGAKFCRQSSHGIPGANPAAAGIVGVKLTSDIYTKLTPPAEGDKLAITATAPTDSGTKEQTYTLTGTLTANGRIDWDNGSCSKSELC